MSLMPAFELGLWNAWIFMLLSLLTWPFFFYLAKIKGAPSPSTADLSKSKMVFCIFSKFIFFLALAYSFFLPLKLGTIWFYIGLPIIIIGLTASVIVLVNWADTPPDKPVTKGLYRYSRHPMYVNNSIYLLGICIASASWIFLIFPIIMTAGAVAFIDLEENGCLEHYGDVYREYMKRTPRWIGIPKPERK